MSEIKFRVLDNDGNLRFPPPVHEWDFNDCQYFAEYTNKNTSVMLYTDCEAKNEVEMCADDIVRIEDFEYRGDGGFDDTLAVVYFERGHFGFRTLPNNFDIGPISYILGVYDIEIIGNIHENSDLIDQL